MTDLDKWYLQVCGLDTRGWDSMRVRATILVPFTLMWQAHLYKGAIDPGELHAAAEDQARAFLNQLKALPTTGWSIEIGDTRVARLTIEVVPDAPVDVGSSGS